MEVTIQPQSQLEDFEGYDIVGLTEVKEANAALYTQAASFGEGAKGSATTDFKYVTGTTGGADRMVILWDNKRFEKIGQLQELSNLNPGNYRAPLFVRLKLRNTSIEFLFMVNHLARGNSQVRQQQATGLKNWAAQQSLPVIAVGDYNFDYNIDDGKGNQAMDNMLVGNVWKWIYPNRVYKTQGSRSYNGLLDFIFVANQPASWEIDSRIITEGFLDMYNDRRGDHRPVEGRVLIPH